MEFVELSHGQLETAAAEAGLTLPIEQTAAWAKLEKTIPGRDVWGAFCVRKDDKTVAFISLFDYLTHGYHYLRSTHGPVWASTPSAADEQELLDALHDFVRKRDRKQVFVRLAVAADLAQCRPTLSTIPYNQTVYIDLEGGAEEILARMKPRGRRDVRKALRESPATYADETELATSSFDEYYDVMIETAQRDGFTPAPQSSYENTIRVLGPEHCRVFAGRVDGKVVTWTITTVNGNKAVRYYGASRSDVPNRNFVTDGLIFFESCTLGEQGIKSYDMMGIGNDFSPTLKGLNTFKTKFSKEIVDVAPDRDLPLRPMIYGSLVKAKQLFKRGAGDESQRDDAKKGEVSHE